jgi:glutamate-1-semialdehyde 2,1-aminomutase
MDGNLALGALAVAAVAALPKAKQRLELSQAKHRSPDLQFTGTYRVPFQYSPYLRQHLKVGSFVQRSDGLS